MIGLYNKWAKEPTTENKIGYLRQCLTELRHRVPSNGKGRAVDITPNRFDAIIKELFVLDNLDLQKDVPKIRARYEQLQTELKKSKKG